MKSKLTRRDALKVISASMTLPLLSGQLSANQSHDLPPVRTITRGPKHHWFGYYDKLEFDPTNRLVLSNEVDFEHRTPTADDVIRVGMVDTGDNDNGSNWEPASAWGWQQGCMLQWRPQSSSEVVWNDRDGDRHVCRVMDVKNEKDSHSATSHLYAQQRWPLGDHCRLLSHPTDAARLRICRFAAILCHANAPRKNPASGKWTWTPASRS